jgi:hypothetical protein
MKRRSHLRLVVVPDILKQAPTEEGKGARTHPALRPFILPASSIIIFFFWFSAKGKLHSNGCTPTSFYLEPQNHIPTQQQQKCIFFLQT